MKIDTLYYLINAEQRSLVWSSFTAAMPCLVKNNFLINDIDDTHAYVR